MKVCQPSSLLQYFHGGYLVGCISRQFLVSMPVLDYFGTNTSSLMSFVRQLPKFNFMHFMHKKYIDNEQY